MGFYRFSSKLIVFAIAFILFSIPLSNPELTQTQLLLEYGGVYALLVFGLFLSLWVLMNLDDD